MQTSILTGTRKNASMKGQVAVIDIKEDGICHLAFTSE